MTTPGFTFPYPTDAALETVIVVKIQRMRWGRCSYEIRVGNREPERGVWYPKKGEFSTEIPLRHSFEAAVWDVYR